MAGNESFQEAPTDNQTEHAQVRQELTDQRDALARIEPALLSDYAQQKPEAYRALQNAMNPNGDIGTEASPAQNELAAFLGLPDSEEYARWVDEGRAAARRTVQAAKAVAGGDFSGAAKTLDPVAFAAGDQLVTALSEGDFSSAANVFVDSPENKELVEAATYVKSEVAEPLLDSVQSSLSQGRANREAIKDAAHAVLDGDLSGAKDAFLEGPANRAVATLVSENLAAKKQAAHAVLDGDLSGAADALLSAPLPKAVGEAIQRDL